MDEQEFDLRFQRPFVRQDAMQADARNRRCATLAVALWGRTAEDLERQLERPYPEIPSDFDLADFRELYVRVHMICALLHQKGGAAEGLSIAKAMNMARYISIPASALPGLVGAHHAGAWEQRREVVRRAIAHLENR